MAFDVGDTLPDFTLPDQRGELFVSKEALGRGPLVLFFYPKDDTSGCTAEVCSFRDIHAELAEAGATVVGISSDSVSSHERFAGRHDLPYRLLADEGGRFRKELGVPRSLLGLMDGRVTYVVDRNGVIRRRYDSLIRAKQHAEEALATVRELLR